MKTCRARSSGSSSSSSRSSFMRPIGRPRLVGEDEVDGLADGQDLRRLLVGHAHAVGVLELLHERVEVERVGLEILAEARASPIARARRRARRRGAPGSARTPPRASARSCAVSVRAQRSRRAQSASRERSKAHSVCARLAPGADTGALPAARPRRLERARASARRCPRARRARRAGSPAAKPCAREAAVRHDAQPAQAEQVGAALPLGVDLRRETRAAPPRSSSAAELAARRGRRRVADRAERSPARRPRSASARRCR